MNETRVRLNEQASLLLRRSEPMLASYRIEKHQLACGATVYDFGVQAIGSLQAGLLFAKLCMSDLGTAELVPSNPQLGLAPLPSLQVTTDAPVLACMASQYAGWPVKVGKFFAMGSGPMRCNRGREKLLVQLGFQDDSDVAIGILEVDTLPNCEIAQHISAECRVPVNQIALCVAPTRSMAGVAQIVARSVETALHQLHELGGELNAVKSAIGWAPIPPPAIDFSTALGRTNDAILYGGAVTLWVKGNSDLMSLVDQMPSSRSRDWGKPFAEIFAEYDHDFYKVDPGLFAPAVVTMVDLDTGRSRTAGQFRPDCLAQSFGTEMA